MWETQRSPRLPFSRKIAAAFLPSSQTGGLWHLPLTSVTFRSAHLLKIRRRILGYRTQICKWRSQHSAVCMRLSRPFQQCTAILMQHWQLLSPKIQWLNVTYPHIETDMWYLESTISDTPRSPGAFTVFSWWSQVLASCSSASSDELGVNPPCTLSQTHPNTVSINVAYL